MGFFFFKEVKKESEEGDEPRAETESESEEELSCFAPTVRGDSHPAESGGPCVESAAVRPGSRSVPSAFNVDQECLEVPRAFSAA